MKGTYLILVFLLWNVAQSFGQIGHGGFFTFFGSNDTIDINCPFDSSVHIKNFLNCTAYQTLNNNYDGPIDSNSCFSIAGYNQMDLYWNDATIKPLETDTNEAIFVMVQLDSTNQAELTADSVYNIEASYGTNYYASHNFSYGNSCPEGYCSEVLYRIRIMESAGAGYTYQWLEATTLDAVQIEADTYNMFVLTFTTENYYQMVLDEIIYKIRPYDVSSGDSILIGEPLFVDYINGIGSVNKNNTDGIKILGDPITDHLKLLYMAKTSGNLSLEIYDLLGQKLMAQIISCQPGANYPDLSIPNISSGEYLLKTTTNNSSVYNKFIKL